MAKKSFSVIIVPHSKTSFRTLSVSKKAVKAVVAGSFLLALALAVVLADYVSMSMIRKKYRALSLESANQKKMIANYESYVRGLKTTIANFEGYAKKLNIMAGLKSPEVIPGAPGLGGGNSYGESGEGNIPLGEPAGNPQNVSLGTIQNLTRKAESVEKNLDTLVDFFESQSLRLASTPTIWPTQGWVSSPFGSRIDPFTGRKQFHYGVDIATNLGNPIAAPADGIVVGVKTEKMLGRSVIISHGGGITTHFGHLDRFGVVAGQKVRRGDIIGYVGRTGKALGPHLHYEVRVNDKAMNPFSYILEE
ncbi:MAG: M23 family metallopeptidase [Acidobacteriota bacterium]|nr:M23 family metallopeptidase [Acidobacteriota bacterium]